MLRDVVEFRVVGVYGEPVDIDGQSGRGGEDFGEDAVKVRKLFQHTQDPRDAENIQPVGIHDFIKKAFNRNVNHPIFEALTEIELELSDTRSKHFLIRFRRDP